MLRIATTLVLAIGLSVAITSAQQPSTTGPYKVLKSAKVGGEGNWDYIYADVAGRRLYIPRRAPAVPAGAEGSAPTSTVRTRLTIFNLDTLEPAGEIDAVGGQGTAVDPKSGHGFTSSRPVSMFDTKTQKLMKTIDTADAQGDGIVFDSFNERVYVFSHPTKDATVIDARDGTVLGRVDLGGGCNGLALDAKNKVLFAACARSGNPPDAKPQMVILSASDGKILKTLPLAGASDGEMFNPSTLEAYSTQGNGTLTIVKETSPTTFEVEQNLQTMNFARTIAFDSKTGHIFTMADERGPAPPAPPGGRAGRGAAIPGTFTILMIGK